MTRTDPSRRRAFTLIELVVVVVILGVVGAAIVPRFVAGSSRMAEVSATSFRDLISAVATRSALTGQRVAVSYDGARRSCEALTWRLRGSPDDWAAPADWVSDPLTPPVVLEGATVESVRIDGAPTDPARWRVEFDPALRRPALSVTVAQTGGTAAWRIDLASGAMRADLVRAGRDGASGAPTVVDLDAAGRTEEVW